LLSGKRGSRDYRVWLRINTRRQAHQAEVGFGSKAEWYALSNQRPLVTR
jgi:hypothetical protein